MKGKLIWEGPLEWDDIREYRMYFGSIEPLNWRVYVFLNPTRKEPFRHGIVFSDDPVCATWHMHVYTAPSLEEAKAFAENGFRLNLHGSRREDEEVED